MTKDVTADVTETIDNENVKRTALIFDQKTLGTGMSVDILNPAGELLCRLNMFNHSRTSASVDVIVDPEQQMLKVRSFHSGRTSFRKGFPGAKLLAIQINAR